MIYKDFKYTLGPENATSTELDNLLLSKFIYKSSSSTSPALLTDVQYFRDLGLPSRNLPAYTLLASQNK